MPGQSRFALAIRRLSSRNQKRFYRRLFQSQTALIVGRDHRLWWAWSWRSRKSRPTSTGIRSAVR